MEKETENKLVERLFVHLYHGWGSSTGHLFGLHPSNASTVKAIVRAIVKIPEIKKSWLFVKHLENHPEVINAPINAGIPMCKICNKTIEEIFREEDS